MRRPHLTPRDLAVLRDVWLYRYVTSAQVSRLHFGHLKLAQRRLRLLVERRLLVRFRAEPSRVGFGEWWYRLAQGGAPLVDAGATLPTRVPRSLGFLAHHALVTDARIWLREACARSGFGYGFVPSYDEVRESGRRRARIALSVVGHQRLLVPDGAFTVERDGRCALFLLEADRGTEPLTGRHPSAIERKFVLYRDAFEARAEEHYARLLGQAVEGFRVVCLVPSVARRDGFLRLAERLDLAPLVWVGLNELVRAPGDLSARCWASAPGGPLRALVE